MSNELNILNDIYSNICNNIQHIKSSKNDILRIKDSIKNLNNTLIHNHHNMILLNMFEFFVLN